MRFMKGRVWVILISAVLPRVTEAFLLIAFHLPSVWGDIEEKSFCDMSGKNRRKNGVRSFLRDTAKWLYFHLYFVYICIIMPVG